MLIHDPMNDKTKIYQLFYSVRILKRFKWDVFKTIFSKQNETMLELTVIIDDSKNNSNNSNNGDNSKNKKNDDGNKVIMIIINSLLQRSKFSAGSTTVKKCSFICVKSILAPINKNTLTIPRLELQVVLE